MFTSFAFYHYQCVIERNKTMIAKKVLSVICICLLLIILKSSAYGQIKEKMSFEEYIRANIPSKTEIDVFLKERSWAQFDSELGYILGNYMPRDGIDESSTISTVQSNGARTAFMYIDRPCRINTYGNSFTQCHQVSDGETWQEYLAAHLGEPIRNFGMGGYGVYQAYRRMIREEKKNHGAEYVILYIWGDDHIRSLLRCRNMLLKRWSKNQYQKEGLGVMFHGNFWCNIELDLKTGYFCEKENLLPTPQLLYKMSDPDWMVDNLKDDLALQMYLFSRNDIADIDIEKLHKLSGHLKCELDVKDDNDLRRAVSTLLDKYAFAATKYILTKAGEFASNNNKKLLVIIFDPYRVTKELIQTGMRYDEEIVNFLNSNNFNYIDMNLAHVEDYKNYNLSVDDYFKRYFIGHYNPTGNHFFAYSIKNRIVEWLSPKPITYQENKEKFINFRDYFQEY